MIKIQTKKIEELIIKVVMLFCTTLAFLFTSSSVFAAELKILRPVSGEKVTGTYQIAWSGFYSGQNSFPYEVRVKNSTCSDTGVAVISSNFSASQLNGQYTQSWNSASVSDGQHCVQYCILLVGGSPQCVYQIFNVVNYSNHSPVISSYPAQLKFTTDEIFKYQLVASDADQDTLFYQLVQAPDFIYLDQNGFMSLGNYMKAGIYPISVVVLDGYGGKAQQNFTLSVTEKVPTSSATATNKPTVKPSKTATSKPTTTQKPTDQKPRLMILEPDEGAEFSGRTNKIAWDYAGIDAEDISEILLEFTPSENEEFKEIYNDENGNLKNYIWDVSDLENGEYYIRISLLDEDSKVITSDSSGVFGISNSGNEEKVLTIFDIFPENKAEIEDTKPTLSAKFEASEGGEIELDSVKISLDGEEITKDCSIDGSGFQCELSEELDYDEHTIKIEVRDTKGQSLEQSWSFYIVEEGGQIDDDGGNTNGGLNFGNIDFEKLKALYPWCGVILFVLLLLFIISLLKKKGDMT